jgi:exopolysaccharide production protein ExoQ
LWIPLIWLFIVASRLPSQWLQGSIGILAVGSLEEGNPLDRAVLTALMLLALIILLRRKFNWAGFFRSNSALFAFVSFGLLSAFWSDFSLIALKRWFRDFGNYFVVLVVLSDPRPLEAVRTLLRRLSYLLISLSILLIKYYPYLAKDYDTWTGAPMFVGATTSKNMLGAVCLVSGMYFFWDIVTRCFERKESRTRKIIFLDILFMAMTLWLLHLASSATSSVCLVFGCLIIAAAHSKGFRRHPALLKVLIPVSFGLYLVLAFGLDMNGSLAAAVGRDPTLTNRTLIWKTVLGLHTNPLIGTGYESFWLGSRLQAVWRLIWVNEAHNGYLEVYLNLGLIGLALLLLFLLGGYRRICTLLASSPALASLNLAFWAIMLFYNMTEAGFRSGLLWLILLLGTLAAPKHTEELVSNTATSQNSSVAEPFRMLPLEPTNWRR